MRYLLVALLGPAVAIAQSLPTPTRTVYKCKAGGKVHYSDSPCLGAQKVDVEPTRGLNRTTGRELRGSDVQRELQREQIAEAAKPLTGMNSQQFDLAARRQRLAPEAQRRCQHLDRAMPLAESNERSAKTPSEIATTQKRLFELRKIYRETGCG